MDRYDVATYRPHVKLVLMQQRGDDAETAILFLVFFFAVRLLARHA